MKRVETRHRARIRLGPIFDELSDSAELDIAYGNLFETEQSLEAEIDYSKVKCWDDLIRSVDKDLFRGLKEKLRELLATILMEPSVVRRITDELFPFFQLLLPIPDQDNLAMVVLLFS